MESAGGAREYNLTAAQTWDLCNSYRDADTHDQRAAGLEGQARQARGIAGAMRADALVAVARQHGVSDDDLPRIEILKDGQGRPRAVGIKPVPPPPTPPAAAPATPAPDTEKKT